MCLNRIRYKNRRNFHSTTTEDGDHPECSKMMKAEDKFKGIIPYAAKRAVKVVFSKKTPAEKESERKHKEYKKSAK